ncbi:MAG: putative integrase core domain protein, partial [Gammaproteobacteria bacterium]
QIDPDLEAIFEAVRNGQDWSAAQLSAASPAAKHLYGRRHNLRIIGGVLTLLTRNGPRPVVPKLLRGELLQLLHSGAGAAHHGMHGTLSRIRSRFFWSGMPADVELHVRLCDVCELLRNPAKKPREELQPIHTGAPGEIVAIDRVGGRESLPRTPRGNRYICTMIDLFTKYAEAVPLRNVRAMTVADVFVHGWICKHGAPLRVLSDQGTQFQAFLFRALSELLMIHKARTVAFHPRTNGACERFNGTLKRLLIRRCDNRPQSWDLELDGAVLAYNTTEHSATGFTPYRMEHGREIRLPVDVMFGGPTLRATAPSHAQNLLRNIEDAYADARLHLNRYQRRMKDTYDLGAVKVMYRPGDRVKLRVFHQRPGEARTFRTKWEKGFTVEAVFGVDLQLRNLKTGKLRIVHHDQVARLDYEPPDAGQEYPDAQDPQQPDDADAAAVEADFEPTADDFVLDAPEPAARTAAAADAGPSTQFSTSQRKEKRSQWREAQPDCSTTRSGRTQKPSTRLEGYARTDR